MGGYASSAAQANGDPGCPARLGGFQILAQLGRGGQATVYLACPWAACATRRSLKRFGLVSLWQHGQLGPGLAARWRLAALKVAHQTTSEALLDEYGYLADPGVAHPHVSQLYGRRYGLASPDLGLDAPVSAAGTVATRDGQAVARPYLALAYVPGLPLSQLIATGRVGDEGWVLRVAVQLSDGLAHLHERGLVHHDVRPANIVIHNWQRKPQATLLDLGAAERLGVPRRRAVYGVKGWLAPEYSGTEPGPVTPLVDIYGLGRVLTILLAEHPISSELQALLAAATHPDPVQRAASIPEMRSLQAGLSRLLGVLR